MRANRPIKKTLVGGDFIGRVFVMCVISAQTWRLRER